MFVCRRAANESCLSVTSLKDVMNEEKGRANDIAAKKLTVNVTPTVTSWPIQGAGAAAGDSVRLKLRLQ